MINQDSNDCVTMVESNLDGTDKTRSVYYKPIVVPGLVYRTIITGGFLPLLMNRDQSSNNNFNNLLDYYATQRKQAKEYLRHEICKVESKRLVVPKDEFLGWMKNGSIDLETYVILRNSVLKKVYQKRIALRKEAEVAKGILSHVSIATTQLIEHVDLTDFIDTFHPDPEPPTEMPFPLVVPLSTRDVLVKCNPDNPQHLSYSKQVICGLMFGLLAAKVVCSFIIRMMPPKLEPFTIT